MGEKEAGEKSDVAHSSKNHEEEQWRTYAEDAVDLIFTTDNTGKMASVNRAVCETLGYAAEELLGKNALDLVHSEERRALAERTLGKMLSGERVHRVELEVLSRDGRSITLEVRGRALYDGSRIVGTLQIARDVTERKRMEDALRESEARFRELADLLPQIVFETDEKGTLTFFNRVGLSSTGYTEEDLRKEFNAFQVFPPEDAMRAFQKMQRVMRGEQMGLDEYSLLRKDGTSIPIMIYSSAIIREGKAVGLRGIIVDMTERKKMEAQLAESQRLATIGETAAMVGHDLRNPLQAMTNTLYLVKRLMASEKAEDRKETLGLVSGLNDAIQYMDKIVSDLQDYARPVPTDLVETSLPDLVKATVSNVKIPGNVEIAVDIQDGSSNVRLDTVLFRRVLTNLILNGVQSMPKGGRLTIVGSRGDESFSVAVQDTGVGITPENLGRVFNPFFTTKAQGQGLGLAVCKRLMEAQGGTIEVASRVGEGSTFTLKLPTNRTPGAT